MDIVGTSRGVVRPQPTPARGSWLQASIYGHFDVVLFVNLRRFRRHRDIKKGFTNDLPEKPCFFMRVFYCFFFNLRRNLYINVQCNQLVIKQVNRGRTSSHEGTGFALHTEKERGSRFGALSLRHIFTQLSILPILAHAIRKCNILSYSRIRFSKSYFLRFCKKADSHTLPKTFGTSHPMGHLFIGFQSFANEKNAQSLRVVRS